MKSKFKKIFKEIENCLQHHILVSVNVYWCWIRHCLLNSLYAVLEIIFVCICVYAYIPFPDHKFPPFFHSLENYRSVPFLFLYGMSCITTWLHCFGVKSIYLLLEGGLCQLPGFTGFSSSFQKCPLSCFQVILQRITLAFPSYVSFSSLYLCQSLSVTVIKYFRSMIKQSHVHVSLCFQLVVTWLHYFGACNKIKFHCLKSFFSLL